MPEEERRAKNEEVFRQVNERIADLADNFAFVGDLGSDFVCECANRACTEKVNLRLEKYREVRAKPRWFIVRPWHADETVESVVERSDEFWTVEKSGEGDG